MLVSLIGTWIQTIAQSWLVFQLTNSAFLLGLVGFLNLAPVFLLSLFGGVVADRVNKRKILIFTQIAFMILAFLLAVLTQLKLITPYQIMMIAVLNGIVMAFDGPARQSVVVELVGKRHLLNAIALNSASFNSARVIGPALAGILIASIGMSGCFYANGISFFAVIAALLTIRINNVPKREKGSNLIEDLIGGLRFIRNSRLLFILIIMVAITSLFGISYMILMPIFADQILRVGAKGLGVLMSATGLGALAAALLLARNSHSRHKGRLLIYSCIIYGISLVLFALSKNYAVSLLVLVFVGATSVMAMSLVNTLLQELAPDEFRGRLMSVFMFTFAGIMPFGNLIAGGLAQIWGVSLTVMFSGVICILFFTTINFFYPEIRRLK